MSTYRPATSKMTRGPDKQPKYFYYYTNFGTEKFWWGRWRIAQYSSSFWALTPIKDVEISADALY